MTVADIMTKDVFTCKREDSLEVPARLMWDHDCGCIPIVDDERRPVGILTDRDVCMAAYTTGKPLGSVRVGHAMAHGLLTCKPTDSIVDAEELMRANQIRRILVVDGGRLAGILSLNDVAVASIKRPKRGQKRDVTPAGVGETLAAICARRPGSPAGISPSA